MAFQELMRRLLAADIALGVLLAFSYLGIVATGAPLTPETTVIMQLGGVLILLNFLIVGAVLYTGWQP